MADSGGMPPPLKRLAEAFLPIRGMFLGSSGFKKPMSEETADLPAKFEQLKRDGGYNRMVEPASILLGDWAKAGTFRNVKCFCREKSTSSLLRAPSSRIVESERDECVAYVELMAASVSDPWVRNLVECHRGQHWSNVGGSLKMFYDSSRL
jgi:hypothetical protein